MLLADLRLVLRDLRRRPMFAATVVLTLAIGIGATTAAFALIDAVFLTRLPVRDQGRVVGMWPRDPRGFLAQWPVPWGIQQRLIDRRRAFSGVAAYRFNEPYGFAARTGDRTVHVAVTAVDGHFFDVLGVHPELGRLIRPDDDVPGGPDLVVLSDHVWRADFGADAAILGRLIFFAGGWHRVIGVAPPEFSYPVGTTVWTAVVREWRRMNGGAPDSIGFLLVGRLRPGVSRTQAREDFEAVLRSYPATNALYTEGANPVRAMPTTGTVEPYADLVLGRDLRPGVIILFVAVALVLVIACTNVAGLLLARGIARENELAVRSALGATQARLAGHLLTESAVLGTVGGLLGLAVAVALINAAVAFAPDNLPMIATAHLDPTVLLFAAITTASSVILFGLTPAVHGARRGTSDVLRAGSRSVTGSPLTRLTRRALVAAQLALALVVLSGAGLLGRTLARLERMDLGFDPAHLLFFRMDVLLPSRAMSDSAFDARIAAARDRLAQRLPTTRGFGGLTTTLSLPFSGVAESVPVAVDEEAATPANPKVQLDYALDDYFGVMGIPLRQGRSFTRLDDKTAAAVVVISESFARQAWPGQDPIGHRVRFAGDQVVGRSWTVVGIAADVRYDDLAAAPRPTVYLTPRQTPPSDPWYVVRTRGDPARAVDQLEQAIERVDPVFGLARNTSGAALLDARLARPRALTALLTALSGTALLLAAIGLFGVLSTFVRERRREIAVRSALGATPARLRALVLTQTLAVGAAGLACGLPLAVGGSHILHVMVRDVRPTDALTVSVAAVVLLAVVAVAAYVPVVRAAQVDPRTALSGE
jgi:putative ABC transport system permease protein